MIRYPQDYAAACGPTTYLHAGVAKAGWPADHSVDDTYECPPHTWKPSIDEALTKAKLDHASKVCNPPRIGGFLYVKNQDTQYIAEFGTDGSARLILVSKRKVGTFDTFADAQTAAQALNEAHGF